jgi:lysophospholipase L1-like esterase
VVDTAQGEFPPQIEVLSPDTRLITVTIGGNDIGLNANAVICSNPDTVCGVPEGLDDDIAGLRPQLTAMIDTIRGLAPEATVVLVTYPREFPDDNCPELSLADEELTMLRSMGEQLQAAFVDVAAETGVVLVDPYAEPGDHTGCAPASDRWVAGATADDGFAFHPTALGHRVMADMISAALRG